MLDKLDDRSSESIILFNYLAEIYHLRKNDIINVSFDYFLTYIVVNVHIFDPFFYQNPSSLTFFVWPTRHNVKESKLLLTVLWLQCCQAAVSGHFALL